MPSPDHQTNSDRLAVADRLHSAAIHLLRRLRVVDDQSGLSAPRLSALSVVVFAGPISMGALAAAEQVRAPTMTRLIGSMELAGLVRREVDPRDARVQKVVSTAKGRTALAAGRRKRVESLAIELEKLAERDLRTLAIAAELIDSIASNPVERTPPRRRV